MKRILLVATATAFLLNGCGSTTSNADSEASAGPQVNNENDQNSNWVRRENTDPMTDEKHLSYYLGTSPQLVIICSENNIQASVMLKGLLGKTNFPYLKNTLGNFAQYSPISVLIRLDGAQPYSENWKIHLEQEFIRPEAATASFAENLRGHSKVAIRPDQLNSYVFDIRGYDSVYREMSDFCKK